MHECVPCRAIEGNRVGNSIAIFELMDILEVKNKNKGAKKDVRFKKVLGRRN
jgi:hypothetical protein